MASQKFNMIPGDMRATLLREFSKPGLSQVTHFKLRISRSLSYVSGLGMFIACLPCVETLVTEKPFLLYLSSCMPPKWRKPTTQDCLSCAQDSQAALLHPFSTLLQI